MRFFLAAEGTRGDVQPLIALGTALKARGHDVTLAATPNFAAEAHRFGLAFHSFGIDAEQLMREQAASATSPLKLLRFMKSNVRRSLRAQFDVLAQHAHQADVIVTGGIFFAASSFCAVTKIPFRYIAYTPQIFESGAHHPVFFPAANLPRWLNRVLWAVAHLLLNFMMRAALNDERRGLGLRAVPDVSDEIMNPKHALVAADPEIAPVPADIEGFRANPTGSWHLKDDRELGAEVEEFLSAGDAPVYVGFGSMPDPSPEKTTHEIVEAVDALGCRAIVCAGWARLGRDLKHPRILAIDSAPHAKLFPRMAAIVHHGGAGTTSASTRAGVPQIIVPHLLDQFRWAHYVESAGLGPRPLLRVKFGARELVLRLRDALTNARMRERAANLGREVRARDAIGTAIGELERVGAKPTIPSIAPPPARRMAS